MTAPRFWPPAVFAALLGGVSLAVPPAETPTKAEVDGLRSLHHTAVKHFIDRNGFGATRMPLNLSDILNPPSSASEGPTALQPPGQQPREPQAIKTGAKAKDAHFPLAKLVAKRAYLPAPARDKQWVVKDIQLIGLVKHPGPVVYLTGGAIDGPMTKEEKEEKTREPDGFEAKALDVVRGGGGLHAERRGAEFRAVAGIYAGKRCASCHERNGEMLGAFSYRLAIEDARVEAASPAPPAPRE